MEVGASGVATVAHRAYRHACPRCVADLNKDVVKVVVGSTPIAVGARFDIVAFARVIPLGPNDSEVAEEMTG